MRKFIVFIALSAALLSSEQLLAWGQKGHDVVCAIAQSHLTSKAKREIGHILGGKSIVYYASWLDNVQNSPLWDGGYDVTKTWHYANVDEGFTYQTMQKEPKGDLLTALTMIIDGFNSGQLSDSVRCDYLKMLVHLVGDLHCPMHAGHKSDRGGNNFQVKWFGQQTNIHSVWDSKLIESTRKWSYTEWVDQIDRADRKQIKQICRGSIADWLDETVEIGRQLYSEVKAGDNLSYQYQFDHDKLLEDQLLKAGLRLSSLLNELFG